MAKKKRRKAGHSRIKRASRNIRAKKMKSSGMRKPMDMKRRISIVINNLLLFIALSLVSFAAYRFVPKLIENQFLQDLFSVTAMVFGFVASGFLIVLIILLVMKLVKKR